MELQPKRQPGRADRKAAAYAVEIARLRSTGYTYEAIREALAEVGIALSTSALRREVRRLRGRSTDARPGSLSGPKPATARPMSTGNSVQPSSSAPPSPAAPSEPVGRDIAEAFFKAHHSNLLLNTEEIP